jgi:trehalose synthase-fused probable maltokinase
MTSTMECLTDWMMRQRWYGGKGRVPALRLIGSWDIDTHESGVRIRTQLIMDDASNPPTLYQIPITRRQSLLPGGGLALIGRAENDEFVYDGAFDPAYARALLRMMLAELPARADGAEAWGHAAVYDPPSTRPAFTLDDSVTTRVLSGEQSNTSIIFERPGDPTSTPIICKVFRALHHGENPDVTLQTALTEAGSPYVPRSIGHITGEWNDVGRSSGRAQGHLAFAQEFLPGVEDAWRVAVRAADHDEDFSSEAFELGEATAEVHRTLAEVMPSRPASLGDVVSVVANWHQRLAIAMAEVPEIREHKARIEAVFDAAQAAPWPSLQRIHGDYHLGQVLHVPGRGWVLLDFEGEPLRPMSERDLPDLVLRDVAGMLRSFDYVAGSLALANPDRSVQAWAHAARRAFVDGYIHASGNDLREHRALLDAFEIDKAVYEAVYEARNRPAWVGIPVHAIARLLSRERVSAG